MKTYIQEPVIETIWRQGERLKTGLDKVIADRGLQDYVQIIGKPCALVFACRDAQGHASQDYRTLFLQETIKRGLLMTSLIISYSHTDEDVDRTIAGIDDALEVYSQALDEGVDKYLVGRPSKSVYRKFN